MNTIEKNGVKVHWLEKGESAPAGTKVYDFYADDSHGWLKVSYAELIDLGIAIDITYYSYTAEGANGKVAYLEEDCDFGTFARAKKELYCRSHRTKGSSVIRSYDMYEADNSVFDAMPKEIIAARIEVLEKEVTIMPLETFNKFGKSVAEMDEEHKGWSPFKYAWEDLDGDETVAYDPKRNCFLLFRYGESRNRWLLFTRNGKPLDNKNAGTIAFIKWENAQKKAAKGAQA